MIRPQGAARVRASGIRARHQQGMVLYVALIVMIAMMLAGVAMLRSVGTGAGVAGNLAFKQNASMAGDRGAEAAVAWLKTSSSIPLENDDAAHGYFATWDPAFDPLTFDWSNAAVRTATNDDGAGNKVRYVIHRLCKQTGPATQSLTQECAVHGHIVTGVTGGTGGTSLKAGAISPPLFRVTSRVDGPRNTLSYIQVVVY